MQINRSVESYMFSIQSRSVEDFLDGCVQFFWAHPFYLSIACDFCIYNNFC